ncbi:hypothetical protein K2173_010276 [Erythroxylum novogranatense]|uniref:Uncharacterized protein n=1 Tax=Erythroxylum novogranatense TaxID=1862640 RepID=A0AAV8TDD8_9ROSI|nr:hypothetical protein K2173_010276 [Erythroxylum novogranatense]
MVIKVKKALVGPEKRIFSVSWPVGPRGKGKKPVVVKRVGRSGSEKGQFRIGPIISRPIYKDPMVVNRRKETLEVGQSSVPNVEGMVSDASDQILVVESRVPSISSAEMPVTGEILEALAYKVDCAWKCVGVAKRGFLTHVKELCRLHRPDILIIVEPRISDERAIGVAKKVVVELDSMEAVRMVICGVISSHLLFVLVVDIQALRDRNWSCSIRKVWDDILDALPLITWADACGISFMR